MTLAQVTAEVNARHPVTVDITWNAGSDSHVVVIAAVLNDSLLILGPVYETTVIGWQNFSATYCSGAKLDGFGFTKPR